MFMFTLESHYTIYLRKFIRKIFTNKNSGFTSAKEGIQKKQEKHNKNFYE